MLVSALVRGGEHASWTLTTGQLSYNTMAVIHLFNVNPKFPLHGVAEVAIHSGEMQVQAAKIGMREVSKKQVVHGQNSQHRSRECGSVKDALTVMQETLGLAASTEKKSQNK